MYYVIINIAHGHLSGSVAVLSFEVNSQINKKYNWQRASAELAICTARVEGHWVEPRVLLHALHHYVLRVKIILVDFNLAVSTHTAKPINLIPHQILRLYSIHTRDGSWDFNF